MTHEYPPNRAFDSVSISRVSALRDCGLTPRQREFLVTVMVHSGCFLERQYCEFTGTVRGQNSREFMARLVARGFARAIEPGPVRRGRLYHVHHKPLYEAIGQADNRNRRLRTIGRMVERVMILDAVLGDRRCWWLSPECDKRAFFDVTQQTGLQPEEYPHIAFGSGRTKTVRCFPDKLPIGIEKDDTSRFVFLYLVNRRDPGGLPPVPNPSPRPLRQPALVDASSACAAALQEGPGALQGGRPGGTLDSAESEREQVPGDVLSRTPGAGRPPRRSIRSLHRAGVPEAGHAEDPSPLSGLATIRRQGSLAVVFDLSARRLVLWSIGRRGSVVEPPVPPAHRLDGPGCVGQEGGEAKIASGWPPGFGTLPGRSLTPGGSVNAHSVQASVSQRLAADEQPRRRSVPPSSSVSVSQSVNQRWRERPRCPAPPVTPGRRDGVVHAIVGRAGRRRSARTGGAGRTRRRVHCLRVQIRRNKAADKSHCNRLVRVICIPGTNVPFVRPDLAAHHRAFHAGAVLDVVNALRCASTRPVAGPSGIDDASARHVSGSYAMVLSVPIARNDLDEGIARAYVGFIASVPHGTSSVRLKGQRSAHPVGAHRARHRAQSPNIAA